MFKEERDYNRFSWEDLGDLQLGRPNLGLMAPVAVYRLLQYTMRDVLIKRFDVKTANEILIESGRLAGREFCLNILDTRLELGEFVSTLQEKLREMKIGLLRVERLNPDSLEMILTVAEDLDCSGLPPADETVCEYDEGFIAGVLEAYTGRPFHVKEIDCWSSGERVCRFEVKPKGESA